jgi:hypothetical protein
MYNEADLLFGEEEIIEPSIHEESILSDFDYFNC